MFALQSGPPQPRDERLRIGQRMASIRAVLRRGQVGVEMQEQRARNVAFEILLCAKRRLGQVVPAVEHPPQRVLETPRERRAVDERAVEAQRSTGRPSRKRSHSWKCSIASSIGDW